MISTNEKKVVMQSVQGKIHHPMATDYVDPGANIGRYMGL